MALTLEQAIARVPFLAEAKNVVSAPLTGGITNLNYRIDADGKSYVLRITGADTEKLGIHRDVEYCANLAAGQLGIAPEVMRQPDNIVRVVQKLRLFHRRGPELNAEYNVFRNVELLTAVSKQHNCRFPFDFDWLMQTMHDVETALRKDPYLPTPCHDDLLNLNFLEEDLPGGVTELRLLDWEYAGMGDVFFDLANFSHNHLLNDEQVRLLLKEYFGEVTPKNYARLRLMWPMSEMREAMWGVTQTGISTLDEDFQGYADLWFGRVRQHITDPRWEQWLRDVSA